MPDSHKTGVIVDQIMLMFSKRLYQCRMLYNIWGFLLYVLLCFRGFEFLKFYVRIDILFACGRHSCLTASFHAEGRSKSGDCYWSVCIKAQREWSCICVVRGRWGIFVFVSFYEFSTLWYVLFYILLRIFDNISFFLISCFICVILSKRIWYF